MTKIVPILTGIVVFLACRTVYAQGETVLDQTAATQIAQLAFEILTPILAALGGWIAFKIVKLIESKTKYDIPDKQEAKIDEWIEQGIMYAAEKSYKKVKEKTDRLKGSEKLEAAADFVHAMAESRGWIDWSKDKIKAKVDAKIGAHRANGGVPSLEAKANG